MCFGFNFLKKTFSPQFKVSTPNVVKIPERHTGSFESVPGTTISSYHNR